MLKTARCSLRQIILIWGEKEHNYVCISHVAFGVMGRTGQYCVFVSLEDAGKGRSPSAWGGVHKCKNIPVCSAHGDNDTSFGRIAPAVGI